MTDPAKARIAELRRIEQWAERKAQDSKPLPPMTPEREAWIAASRAASGVPRYVEDPVALAKVARLIAVARD